MAPARKKKSQKTSSINEAVKILDKAMMALKRKQYSKAQDILEGLRAEYSEDLEIRGKILTLLKICEKKIAAAEAPSPVSPQSSATELYNHGIFCHNNLEYKEALDCFEKGLKKSESKPDYFHYAIAASQARMQNFTGAAESLRKAIEISPENLYRAQNDPNFSELREETEIWESIEMPETGEED